MLFSVPKYLILLGNFSSIANVPIDKREDACDIHKERAEELSEGPPEGEDGIIEFLIRVSIGPFGISFKT
ncbi:MAG: hypothetical protein RTU63_09145 [Candidatus Thorarchaeota archaeon]